MESCKTCKFWDVGDSEYSQKICLKTDDSYKGDDCLMFSGEFGQRVVTDPDFCCRLYETRTGVNVGKNYSCSTYDE